MTISATNNQDYLCQARALVEKLEAGNEAEANQLLDDMTQMRETSLFQEVGKLTREVHDALNSFRLDSRLAELAGKDIPDAKERLQHVIAVTDQAAHKTLTAVEASIPVCEKLEDHAGALRERWERFTRREMQPDEFRALCRELGQFLALLDDDVSDLKTKLNEVLMAQDFQDLTGQMIGRVIGLVGDLEDSLVDLVRFGGSKAEDAEQQESASRKTTRLEGPPVPGQETESTVSGQDEVDELLSSLGF